MRNEKKFLRKLHLFLAQPQDVLAAKIDEMYGQDFDNDRPVTLEEIGMGKVDCSKLEPIPGMKFEDISLEIPIIPEDQVEAVRKKTRG